MQKGRVIKSTGSWYKVRLGNGDLVEARIRGVMRQLGIKTTNPIAVGDWVALEQTTENDFVINALYDRSNYIIRKATKLSKQTHIIAANIDLVLIMVTIRHPKLKLGFLDRLLVSAEAYDIPVLIVFNKTDLLNASDQKYLNELRNAYKDLGYESLAISVEKSEGLDKLTRAIAKKTVLITGHSGVGKSSFINCTNPNINAKTDSVSATNDKGQHTTTFAELFEIDQQTSIIDSPGLKSFGLMNIEAEELKNFFPEMHRLSSACKFHNCLHINEPKCAVRNAFESSMLPWFRYEHYQHFYEELIDMKKS